MAEWDTQAIQERILRDARVPRGSTYSTMDALLPLLDQHLRTVIVPRLLDVGEDYLAASASYAVTSGQSVYRLPVRSLRLLEVKLLDPDGRPRMCFSRATPTQVTKFRSYGRVRPSGLPEFWWFDASAVSLYPVPSTTDGSTLVLRYARRPSRLVDSSTVGVIAQSLSSGGGTLILFDPDSVFGGVTGLPLTVDIVKGTPGFESLGDNIAGELTTTGPITTYQSVSPVDGIEEGDYLCLAGTSPVPQVPLDYLAALELSVCAQILRSDGDLDAAQTAQAAMVATLESAVADFAPRADEATTVVQQDW